MSLSTTPAAAASSANSAADADDPQELGEEASEFDAGVDEDDGGDSDGSDDFGQPSSESELRLLDPGVATEANNVEAWETVFPEFKKGGRRFLYLEKPTALETKFRRQLISRFPKVNLFLESENWDVKDLHVALAVGEAKEKDRVLKVLQYRVRDMGAVVGDIISTFAKPKDAKGAARMRVALSDLWMLYSDLFALVAKTRFLMAAPRKVREEIAKRENSKVGGDELAELAKHREQEKDLFNMYNASDLFGGGKKPFRRNSKYGRGSKTEPRRQRQQSSTQHSSDKAGAFKKPQRAAPASSE